MRVGVNYPWFDYGWDFGLAPPSWRAPDRDPRWVGAIDDDLRRFQALGITVVRWFILADGFTLRQRQRGAVAGPGAAGRLALRSAAASSADASTHFDALLLRASTPSTRPPVRPLQLLPGARSTFSSATPVSCRSDAPDAAVPTGPTPGDPGWVKQGRGETVVDAVRRRRFLDGVLDPLLRVSAGACRGAIFAWEADQRAGVGDHRVASGRAGAVIPWTPHRCAPSSRKGKSRIRRVAIKPTIGFARSTPCAGPASPPTSTSSITIPTAARVLEPHVFSRSGAGHRRRVRDRGRAIAGRSCRPRPADGAGAPAGRRATRVSTGHPVELPAGRPARRVDGGGRTRPRRRSPGNRPDVLAAEADCRGRESPPRASSSDRAVPPTARGRTDRATSGYCQRQADAARRPGSPFCWQQLS